MSDTETRRQKQLLSTWLKIEALGEEADITPQDKYDLMNCRAISLQRLNSIRERNNLPALSESQYPVKRPVFIDDRTQYVAHRQGKGPNADGTRTKALTRLTQEQFDYIEEVIEVRGFNTFREMIFFDYGVPEHEKENG